MSEITPAADEPHARVSTVDELNSLPEGTIIVRAERSNPYDVHVKDTDGGWPDHRNGEQLRWRSVGDDGVPKSSEALAGDAMQAGFVVIGRVSEL